MVPLRGGNEFGTHPQNKILVPSRGVLKILRWAYPRHFYRGVPPRPWGRASPYKHLLSSPLSIGFSLNGRREKGKGKGIEGARPREGGGEEWNLPFLFFLLHALSHAQISPSLSPFNACHAGYIGLKSSLWPPPAPDVWGNWQFLSLAGKFQLSITTTTTTTTTLLISKP